MLDALAIPDRLGAEAWQLILRECGEGTSDLEMIKIKASFNNASITDSVGHKIDTITAFGRHLNAHNSRLTQAARFSVNDICVKFL